jgi:hippurate hydrolase
MRSALALLAILAPGLGAQSGPSSAVDAWLDERLPALTELYRHLHRHPEVSFRELKTAARIAEELGAAGLNVTRNVGGLGVVGVLENGSGPTLMLRADLDALPVGERTGLPYQSTVRSESADGRVGGVMHACGHDLHMTHLVAVAQWLAAHRDAWSGTVVCIGQPAEERAGGAKAMLEDGLFERFPRPDMALALHVDDDLPTGIVGLRAGPAMANVESVDVVLRGRGGHGAAPHTTIDPIPIAARLVLDLQTIVAREVDPIEAAVVTVGAIQGGSKHNVIDAECRLQITLRSYSPAVHAAIKDAVVRKARAQSAASGAPEPEIRFSEFTPALRNDPELTARCADAMRAALGAGAVVETAPAMVAEDFGRFGEAGVPILMYRLGTVTPERLARLREAGEPVPAIHSPFYYPDFEPSLRTAVRATTAAIRHLLAP